MLNSTDIQFLLVIRESASLLATAHKLGLTASAVTQRLQQLERKLGIQLVDRSARQLQFTDEGELLCQRGVGIIDEIAGLMETLHARRHGMVGRLAINAPFGFGRRYVASVVAAFRQRYPDVDIRMTLSDQPLVASSDRSDLVIAKKLNYGYTDFMSYSIDFRRRILSIKKHEGLSIRETAKRFHIGTTTIVRWTKQIDTRPATSRQRKIDKSALERDVEQYPDAYQRERAERFGVCQMAICKALKKLQLTYKKNSASSKSRRRR